MPLKEGSSKETVSANVSELTRSLIRKGDSPVQAQRRAVAAALQKARKSGDSMKKEIRKRRG